MGCLFKVIFSNKIDLDLQKSQTSKISNFCQAFLVDTSEEALLIPDWLKLRMIHSRVQRLVDAAMTNLEIHQLILFVQSFGIPIASMRQVIWAVNIPSGFIKC